MSSIRQWRRMWMQETFYLVIMAVCALMGIAVNGLKGARNDFRATDLFNHNQTSLSTHVSLDAEET
eukprot:6195983-Pleurochrysis_carterae.AAC.2